MTELVDIFIKPMEEAGLDYFVTGSVAAMVYGEPRLTNDINLVVFIKAAETAILARAFPETGYYLPPDDVLQLEAIRSQRGHFNVIHLPTMLKADMYFSGKDELHRWAHDNKRVFTIDGTAVSFAPPEYVIVRKLQYYKEGRSEKHLRDIGAMLAESGDTFNGEFLYQTI